MKYIFVSIFFLMVIAGCKNPKPCEKEIFLLPEDFCGPIIVYFDQPDGQEIEYENDARVYHIPRSGYLKTKFLKNGGCMNNNRLQFFYVDSLRVRTPLDYFLNLEKDSIPKDRDYVLFTFLSNKDDKPEFVIHLVGGVHDFNELTRSVNTLEPVQILESLK